MCKIIKKKEVCSQTASQFHTILNELKNNNELLRPHALIRRKRAPLDIIGNLANSLFGVLDSNYADKMTQIIGNLEGNQEHLLESLKNQTSIVDSTTNIMRKSHDIIQHELREVEEYMNRTISHINDISHEMQDQRGFELVNALSIRLILMITNYQRMQSMLLDVMIDTHHGKVNLLILAPKQLQSQLNLIKENIPPSMQLPIRHNNLLELYSLMTVEGKIATTQIIFRLKLPLFSLETFELLRVISVPVPINDTFLVIKPSSNYLITNMHRDQYYPLSDNEMSMCATISNSVHMCKKHHPLYRKGSNSATCEVGFLKGSPSPSSCKISRTNEITRCIQLLNPNHWIYIAKNEASINIMCGNSVTQKTLFGSGVLNISTGCTISDEFSTIQTHNLYPSSIRTSFVPTKNLTELLKPSEAGELLHQPISHQEISNNITDLRDQLKILQHEEDLPLKNSPHDAHQFGIGYTSLFIVIILAVCCMYRFFRTRGHHNNRRPPIPAPRNNPSDFRLDPNVEEMVELSVQRGGGC